MNYKAVLLALLLLPLGFVIGTVSGLFLAAALHPMFQNVAAIDHFVTNLGPATLAGGLAGAMPVFVTKRFFRSTNGAILAAALSTLFLISGWIIPLVTQNRAFLAFSFSLAEDVPGFIFGSFMAASLATDEGTRSQRFFIRVVLFSMLIAWIGAGVWFLWSLAPLRPISTITPS